MRNTLINRLHDRRLYIIAYIIAIFLGVVSNQALILIMAATVTAVIFLPTRRLGFMGRLFVTLSVYMSINALLAFIPWALKIPMSIWLFAWTIGVLCLGLVIFCRFTSPDRWFPLSEIISSLVSFIVFILMLVQSFSSFQSADLLRVSNGSGVDNMSHLSFIDTVEKQKGYVYGSRGNQLPINSMLGSAANNYPQGYHINAWIFNESIQPFMSRLTDTNKKLVSFLLGSIIDYVFLVFAFIFLATKLVRLDNKKKPWMSAIIVISCTIYTVLGLMFSAFTDGFMPQIMSLHLLLSVITLLFLYCKESDITQKYTYGLLATFSVIGVGLSYFFLLPVALGIFIFTLAADYFCSNQKVKLSKLLLSSLLFIVSFSVVQGAIYVLLERVTSDKINDQGGVLVFDVFYVLSWAVFAMAYLWHNHKKRTVNPLTIGLVVSLVFSMVLFIFQKITNGEVNYYYHKSVLSLLLLTSLVMAMLTVSLIDKARSSGVKILMIIGIIMMAFSNGVGVFGIYLQGKVKAAFTAPELFDYAITITESPICREKSTAILSVRSDQKTDGDIFFNRSMMTLAGQSTATQEIISRWSTPNANIHNAKQVITKTLLENKNVTPESRFLILTRSDDIKSIFIDVLGNERVLFADPSNVSKDSLNGICSSLRGMF
jgi:hypothetical protein cdiviTM7_01490